MQNIIGGFESVGHGGYLWVEPAEGAAFVT